MVNGVDERNNGNPAGARLYEAESVIPGVGKAIGNLWFHKNLPEYSAKFLELCVNAASITGATSLRDPKDTPTHLTPFLATDLLSPENSDNPEETSKQFIKAFESRVKPEDYVEQKFEKQEKILGLIYGDEPNDLEKHYIEVLKSYINHKFPCSAITNYAVEVEAALKATRKPEIFNLSLQAMICLGMTDMMYHSSQFTDEETKAYVDAGVLSGMLVFGRTTKSVGQFLRTRFNPIQNE